MKKGFTIIELLVSMGLFAAVIAAAGMVFHYSIESQRTAAATAEIMRTLRAVTDQLNIDFQGLRSDGFLILYSEQKNPPTDTNNVDALYYFSTGDYQSWNPAGIRSNIARIFLGHCGTTSSNYQQTNNLARDVLLLATTHARTGVDDDCANISFEECQASSTLFTLLGDSANIFSAGRPTIDTQNQVGLGRLLSQNVGSFKIEWTYGWIHTAAPGQLVWWGLNKDFKIDSGLAEPNNTAVDWATAQANVNETPGPPYMVEWNQNLTNLPYWPKALKFTFTLYDSKRILKGGRTFEHIVYLEK